MNSKNTQQDAVSVLEIERLRYRSRQRIDILVSVVKFAFLAGLLVSAALVCARIVAEAATLYSVIS